MCTDNWYTSLDLANQLIAKNTHLVGTLRANRKGNPKEVLEKKLKRGEFIGKENKSGITILKWKDKRDILVLSTKHSVEMVNVQTKTRLCSKPKIVVDYNAGKTAVDISDQMNAYSSPLRKSMKWYKKLAFELLLNTSVVNAWVMYQEVTGNKISIITFRKKLAVSLTQCPQEETSQSAPTNTRSRHQLEEKQGEVHKVRKFCKKCYEINAKKFGRKIARNCTKKVVTFCNTCKGKPHLCLKCFNKFH